MTALGHDPTVERIRQDDNTIQYKYLIGNSFYQTTRVLDKSRSLDIVTRATRVWAVRRVGEDGLLEGDELALKVAWLFSDARPVQAIQTELISNLTAVDTRIRNGEHVDGPPVNVSLEEDAKKYFMTILSDDAVIVDGHEDVAAMPRKHRPFHFASKTAEALAKPTTVTGSLRSQPEDMPLPPTKLKTPNREIHHKDRTHRRILFKECCETLYDITKYSEMVYALMQLIEGKCRIMSWYCSAHDCLFRP